VVCEIDGEPPDFRWADPATAAVDARIGAGDLVEEASHDREVRKHDARGAVLVEGWAEKERQLREDEVPMLRAIDRPIHVANAVACGP
jgi:hypothetical protein